jgi:hypothetical protein
MRRTDLQDTPEWVHKLLIKRLQQMTLQEKCALLNARIEEMRQMRRHTEHLRKEKP